MVRRILSVCVFVCVWGSAYALPSNDDHAYTLQHGVWQTGVWDARYGVTDSIEVSSAWPILLVGLPNAGVKWRFYDGEFFSASASTSIFYFDASRYGNGETSFTSTLIPTSLTGSWDLHPFYFSGSLVTTQISTHGAPTQSSNTDDNWNSFTGALNMETTIFRPALYWDRGDGFAWLFDVTFSLDQQIAAQGDTVIRLEDDTGRVLGRGVLQGRGEADLSARKARSFSVSALWHWTNFHLKLGLSMGHFMLPYVNIFPVDDNNQPQKLTVPKFDMYWRF